MKFVTVAERLPNTNTSGAALFFWSVIKCLLDAGHQVEHIIIGDFQELYAYSPEELQTAIDRLEKLGVKVHRRELIRKEVLVPKTKLAKFFAQLKSWTEVIWPTAKSYDQFFKVDQVKARLGNLLDTIAPNAVFVFGFDGIAALRNFTAAPKMALPGDPIDQIWQARLKYSLGVNWKGKLQCLRQVIFFRKFSRWLLKDLKTCQSVVWTAAQHAAWAQNNGISQCKYLPHPIPDALGPDWQKLRSAVPPNSRPKILHLGHLGGTAAMSGLYILLKETLPLLEQALGPDGFEIHFIGRKDVSPDVLELLQRPSVSLRGFVDDLTQDFLNSDIYIVPIPHKVGCRTRLMTAFSYGSCVVAHQSAKLGNPELEHGENVLLAKNGKELAQLVIKAINDPHLREHLRLGARQTYEKHFSLEKAAGRYLQEFVRIAENKNKGETDVEKNIAKDC